jgi:hypothetical protein
MMIDFRPARPSDYSFALNLYLETLKPYASPWMTWVDEEQKAQFASLWRPDDTRIITLDGQKDIGWVEFRQTGDEVFLKQLYISPAHQRHWLACFAAAGGGAVRDSKVDGAVRVKEQSSLSIL